MKYTKMHGAGNSFVILENMCGELNCRDLNALARKMCAENSTDGMMVVVPGGEEADFGMLFYNADGSLGEMCGNGARCIARYGYEHGYASDPENIKVRSTAGMVYGKKIDDEVYEIKLNQPSVIDLHRKAEACGIIYDCAYLELGDPGIPHAVVAATEEMLADKAALRELGRALRYSEAFPKGANVTFYIITGTDAVRAITFERGVEDFTLACGTGCGSMTCALWLQGKMSGERLSIEMPGGHLSVLLVPDENKRPGGIYLTGPTAVVCEADIAL